MLELNFWIAVMVKDEFGSVHIPAIVMQLFRGFNLGYTLDVILQ